MEDTFHEVVIFFYPCRTSIVGLDITIYDFKGY